MFFSRFNEFRRRVRFEKMVVRELSSTAWGIAVLVLRPVGSVAHPTGETTGHRLRGGKYVVFDGQRLPSAGPVCAEEEISAVRRERQTSERIVVSPDFDPSHATRFSALD